jgi:hypothetical protein
MTHFWISRRKPAGAPGGEACVTPKGWPASPRNGRDPHFRPLKNGTRSAAVESLPAQPSGAGCICARHTAASVAARNGAVRAIVIIAGLLLSASAAHAIECQSSPSPSNKNQWAWRLIDNKKCWYTGEPGMDKSKLHWAADADRAPEPAQRTAPDPPKRTAPVGIGPTVPASEIDWAARLASANSESSAMSIPAGTDAVGTESNAPPQRDAASPSAALVGALIFVLLTLWALAARAFLLQQMPPPATIKRAGPRAGLNLGRLCRRGGPDVQTCRNLDGRRSYRCGLLGRRLGLFGQRHYGDPHRQ